MCIRDSLFYVRDIENGDSIKHFIETKQPKKAFIIGSGYIGLEMAENLVHLGLEVTVIEMAASIGRVDSDLSKYIEKHLRKKGVNLILSDAVDTISEDGTEVQTKGGKGIKTDMIIAAIGVVPNVEFLQSTGCLLYTSGIVGGAFTGRVILLGFLPNKWCLLLWHVDAYVCC